MTRVISSYQQRFKSTAERFWEKVDKSGECWTWTACKDKDGYGFFRHEGRNRKAHRFVLEEFMALSIDRKTLVCHRCDNPSCVRPEHLFVGDNGANQRDAAIKGRQRSQKLMPRDVRELRALRAAGADARSLAARYGIDKRTVYSIARREKWAHVD